MTYPVLVQLVHMKSESECPMVPVMMTKMMMMISAHVIFPGFVQSDHVNPAVNLRP